MGDLSISDRMLMADLGVGKSSLIKSIVQTCEDIVHVDPVVSKTAAAIPALRGRQAAPVETPNQAYEVYASTRPYPSWWSEIEDSKLLRRRKSMGDTILDRNLCFVDTEGANAGSVSSDYIISQFRKAATVPMASDVALLSGGGGPQVDVVFFLLSQGS